MLEYMPLNCLHFVETISGGRFVNRFHLSFYQLKGESEWLPGLWMMAILLVLCINHESSAEIRNTQRNHITIARNSIEWVRKFANIKKK